jgi:hypothetical protein
MASRHIVLILNPLSGSGMHQPTVRRAACARQIDVREVCAGYRAEALARDAVDKGVPARCGCCNRFGTSRWIGGSPSGGDIDERRHLAVSA